MPACQGLRSFLEHLAEREGCRRQLKTLARQLTELGAQSRPLLSVAEIT